MAGESDREVTVDIQAIRQSAHLKSSRMERKFPRRMSHLQDRWVDYLPAAAESRKGSPP